MATGNTGLHIAVNSRKKSAEVTWRGGELFQSTPERMRNVYVFPPLVMPPFDVVGTALATSGAIVIARTRWFDGQ